MCWAVCCHGPNLCALTWRLRVTLWCEERGVFLTKHLEMRKWSRDMEAMNPESTWFPSGRTPCQHGPVGGSFCRGLLAPLKITATALLTGLPLTQNLSFPSPPPSVWHSGVIYLYQQRQWQCFTGGHSGMLNRPHRVPQVPQDGVDLSNPTWLISNITIWSWSLPQEFITNSSKGDFCCQC